MLKAFSGVCLSMMLIAGCSGGEPATPAPAKPDPAAAEAARLSAALLPAPTGMRVTHGPETGAYGALNATKQGMEAVRLARVENSGCSGIGQLDPAQVSKAPTAVVAYSSDTGSITQALVATDTFPGPMPKKCAKYEATVSGKKVTYTTKAVGLPKWGEQARGFLTTVQSDGETGQIGAVLIRRANVVMSLLVVGTKVKKDGLIELGKLADEKLTQLSA